MARRGTPRWEDLLAILLTVARYAASLFLVWLVAADAKAAEPVALTRARPYLPHLLGEQRAWWPSAPFPSAFAGQIEQESLWRKTAALRTSREEGRGFVQITRTDRFDSLAELRGQFRDALGGWNWQNVEDPTYQFRAIVLMNYRNWRVVTGAPDPRERFAMATAAYNGGLGGLNSDRRVCAATPGCDPSKWFGHVERTTMKAHKPVAGYGESFACTNHRYASRIADRSTKYLELMGGPAFVGAPSATVAWGCRP